MSDWIMSDWSETASRALGPSDFPPRWCGFAGQILKLGVVVVHRSAEIVDAVANVELQFALPLQHNCVQMATPTNFSRSNDRANVLGGHGLTGSKICYARCLTPHRIVFQ